ncbi:hypothetical protein AGMMS50212_10300 [Spirochaetia bacterium]|nr:hypothetical protein AGMMS50212_10300 [Spirochaetia bacterium]
MNNFESETISLNNIDIIKKPHPTTAEIIELIHPYIIQMINEHPVHGISLLKLHFRDSKIAFIGLEKSVSFLPNGKQVNV